MTLAYVCMKITEYPPGAYAFVLLANFCIMPKLQRKFSLQRGSCMVWEINMGVCPRLEFDNIMFINCLVYDFYIYGAFEFLCNFIANL